MQGLEALAEPGALSAALEVPALGACSAAGCVPLLPGQQVPAGKAKAIEEATPAAAAGSELPCAWQLAGSRVLCRIKVS